MNAFIRSRICASQNGKGCFSSRELPIKGLTIHPLANMRKRIYVCSAKDGLKCVLEEKVCMYLRLFVAEKANCMSKICKEFCRST